MLINCGFMQWSENSSNTAQSSKEWLKCYHEDFAVVTKLTQTCARWMSQPVCWRKKNQVRAQTQKCNTKSKSEATNTQNAQK